MTTPEPAPAPLPRLFTPAAAAARGIPATELRGRDYRRVLYGVYALASSPARPFERIEAALMVHPPGAFASHTSAAHVYRLPVPPRLTDVHVTVRRRGDRRSRRGVRSHLAGADARQVLRGGVPVSPPDQLFVELAGVLDLVELVVVGDAMVGADLITPDALCRAADDSTARHARAARRAAGYVRCGVDSPMESRLRMLLVLSGLPEPEVNVVLRRADGSVRYRLDLGYPAVRLAVEYDGRHHRADLDQWGRDVERDDWLDAHGWHVVKVFSRGVYREPEATVQRVRSAMQARGATVPRRLREDWRPFFPSAA